MEKYILEAIKWCQKLKKKKKSCGRPPDPTPPLPSGTPALPAPIPVSAPLYFSLVRPRPCLFNSKKIFRPNFAYTLVFTKSSQRNWQMTFLMVEVLSRCQGLSWKSESSPNSWIEWNNLLRKRHSLKRIRSETSWKHYPGTHLEPHPAPIPTHKVTQPQHVKRVVSKTTFVVFRGSS